MWIQISHRATCRSENFILESVSRLFAEFQTAATIESKLSIKATSFTSRLLN